MKLFIGCSSRNEIPNKYYVDCKKVLENLFSCGYELVFGACSSGLMGLSYDVAMNNSSKIIGVFPEFYKDEADSLDCVKIPVKTVGERTDKIIKESDALIFLPGGIGTVYELFTAIESKRGNEHNKPIIIYNCGGFYDYIFEQLDMMEDEKFISSYDKEYYVVCSSCEEVIEYLNNYNNKISNVLK